MTTTVTPDYPVRDSLIHDGFTALLSPDFQSPDIILRRSVIPLAIVDEMLASHTGWARDPSEAMDDLDLAYCYLRIRYDGAVGKAIQIRLFEADSLGCAPPRATWKLLGERSLVLSPGLISYTREPIEIPMESTASCMPSRMPSRMLIAEVESDDLQVLSERGDDVSAFHRDLVNHAGLRFKSLERLTADSDGVVQYQLPVRNFGDSATPARIRLIGGLPVGTSVQLSIADLELQHDTTIMHRPERVWLDATLPDNYNGCCDIRIQLPENNQGHAGFQLRTAYHRADIDHVVDGGAHNIQIIANH